MRINSRKFSEGFGQRLNTFLEPFCTQEAPRCIGMNATLITFYFLKKIKQGFFLYYISCKEKINVELFF
jgi:hypothetical protein